MREVAYLSLIFTDVSSSHIFSSVDLRLQIYISAFILSHFFVSAIFLMQFFGCVNRRIANFSSLQVFVRESSPTNLRPQIYVRKVSSAKPEIFAHIIAYEGSQGLKAGC